MSWFRVDDTFAEHPKLEALEDRPREWAEAMALWMAAGCYCSRHQTDGAVPASRLMRLTPMKPAAVKRAAKNLVEIGLWLNGNGPKSDRFLFKDWSDYNATREEIRSKREQKSERQSRWKRAKTTANAEEVDASPDAPRDGPKDGAPSHPIPSHPIKHTHSGSRNVTKKKLHSSLAEVPHPNDPSKTYSSARYVVEAFRAIARTIGQDITPSAIRHKERAALELIERLALESIEHVEVGREVAFANLVNERMNRYRDAHKESPQKTPWKATWIAERWPALGAAA